LTRGGESFRERRYPSLPRSALAILIIAIVLGVAPVLAAIGLAAARLAFSRRGTVHRLSRIDLRGMFLLTAGLAAMLSLTKLMLRSDDSMNSFYAACFLPFLLPMIWLGRYVVQDVWEASASRNKLQEAEPDLSFLDEDRASGN
jgi:hypothetical protein